MLPCSHLKLVTEIICTAPQDLRGGSAVKSPPTLPDMQESQFRSLGWEDALEEGMATRSYILAGKFLWTEEPGRLQFMGLQRVRYN